MAFLENINFKKQELKDEADKEKETETEAGKEKEKENETKADKGKEKEKETETDRGKEKQNKTKTESSGRDLSISGRRTQRFFYIRFHSLTFDI